MLFHNAYTYEHPYFTSSTKTSWKKFNQTGLGKLTWNQIGLPQMAPFSFHWFFMYRDITIARLARTIHAKIIRVTNKEKLNQVILYKFIITKSTLL